MIDFRLDGRHALVTGASRGIGAAIAVAFAAAGVARLTLVARSGEALHEIAGEARRHGADASALVCDVTDVAALQAAFAGVDALDILVCSAGANVPQPLAELDLDVADALWALNVRAGLHAAREAACRMRAGGVIVFLSSQMGHVGAPRRSVYCATKHAVEGMTRALAVELAPRGRARRRPRADVRRDGADGALHGRRRVSRRRAAAYPARAPRDARGGRGRGRLRRVARCRLADGLQPEDRRGVDSAVIDARVRLTTGQALVRWLQAQWSERDGERRRAVPAIWGIFGHGNVLGLGQALAQEGAELPLYQPKHEQSMVHAALGFAKAARRLQLQACTASIGPGATNLLTGAATATVNRLPVLLLPADTFATRRSGVVLQQLEDPLGG